VIGLQRCKDEARARHITKMLETLRQGTVIVEGMHDVSALRFLGVEAVPYSRLFKSPLPGVGKKVFLMTDNDRGGKEKREKIKAMLLEANSGYVMDEVLGKRMLDSLNVKCVEQICGPVEEAMEKKNK